MRISRKTERISDSDCKMEQKQNGIGLPDRSLVMAKEFFGEMTVRQKDSPRRDLTAKCPHGELSWRTVACLWGMKSTRKLRASSRSILAIGSFTGRGVISQRNIK